MSGASVWRSPIKTILRFGIRTPKNPRDRASKSAAGKFNPAISRSLNEVRGIISDNGMCKVCVNGDATFLKSVTIVLPNRQPTWVSTSYQDIERGALLLEQADLTSMDAVICGGHDVASRWRQSLQIVSAMQREGNSLPVFWVGEGWEFCSGSLPVPAEADDAEAVLFNHFEQFFGIRDQLQFKISIYHGAEEKHFYRILEPNQSIVLRLSDYFPERRHAAAFVASVEHPSLTRGRHYRMRLCADVFWKNSLTTLHSAHEFNRSPEKPDEFRLSRGLLRDGNFVITIPNFDLNQKAGSTIETDDGQKREQRPRDLTAYLQEISVTPAAEPPGDRGSTGHGRHVGCRYLGYGGVFWFAFDQAEKNGGSLSANHHISVSRTDRPSLPQSAEEIARLDQLANAGYMIDPHPVPVMRPDQPLRFGFDCDSANPPCRDFLLHLFDDRGALLTTLPYAKTHLGPSFPEHFLAAADPALAAATRLAVAAPDWRKNGQTRAGYKLQPDLVIEDRRSGDRDVTEFQSCWRNLGVAIEGFPHWLSPANGIVGRSNLTARVRHGNGYATGLMIVNGSGSLHYKRSAKVKVVVYDLDGTPREAVLTVPAFTQRLVWLQDLIPDLGAILPAGVGALMVKSSDADLNCQLVTTNQHGGVSLQHLWGY